MNKCHSSCSFHPCCTYWPCSSVHPAGRWGMSNMPGLALDLDLFQIHALMCWQQVIDLISPQHFIFPPYHIFAKCQHSTGTHLFVCAQQMRWHACHTGNFLKCAFYNLPWAFYGVSVEHSLPLDPFPFTILKNLPELTEHCSAFAASLRNSSMSEFSLLLIHMWRGL